MQVFSSTFSQETHPALVSGRQCRVLDATKALTIELQQRKLSHELNANYEGKIALLNVHFTPTYTSIYDDRCLLFFQTFVLNGGGYHSPKEMSVAHYLMNGVAQCIQIQIATGLCPFSFFLPSFLLCFLCVYFLLITLKWELTSPPSSSGCDLLFTAKWKTVDLNGWIAWKTKLNLRSHFWTDKNLHGSAFRIHGTRGTMQVFEVTAKCACFCPD